MSYQQQQRTGKSRQSMVPGSVEDEDYGGQDQFEEYDDDLGGGDDVGEVMRGNEEATNYFQNKPQIQQPKVPVGNSRTAATASGLPPVSKTTSAAIFNNSMNQHSLMQSSMINHNQHQQQQQQPQLPLTEKQLIISKLKGQNDKLKSELKLLTSKLEEFIDKSRQKKQQEQRITPGIATGAVTLKENEKDEAIRQKEQELKQSQNKIAFYKKEIEAMRRQLEGSYNIQKIIQLEDELKNKQRILKSVQDENEALLKVQREQEKALQALNKEGDYDKKISELNEELRKQKEQLRKLQFRYREEEKNMKHQHEQLVMLEERCRKMVQLIKDKKKERQKLKDDIDSGAINNNSNNQQANPNGGPKYTQDELEKLQYQLKEAEQEKQVEERRLKTQIVQQEASIKSLQNELNILNLQIKEKDQEYRLNELKIRELRRQLPAKVLKPLDANGQQLNQQKVGNKARQSSVNPPANRDLEQASRTIAPNPSQSKMQLKPPVPKSHRKDPPRSMSPVTGKAPKDQEKERHELEKSNYVDQRELKYEQDHLNKKRFFSTNNNA